MKQNSTSFLLSLLLFSAALSVSAQETHAPMPQDYTQGIIMLNEDMFGTSSGSMNFIARDGSVYYNVYKTQNAAHSLGNTAQFGDVFGDYLYVVSKQPYASGTQSGGRLVCIHAATMQFVDEIVEMNGADGRSFCAVDNKKGYIGTSQGIYTIDLVSMQIGDKQLVPSPDGAWVGQTGDMLRYGNRVFAAQEDMGAVVIDVCTDQVQVIDIPGVVAPFVTADGSLYWTTTNNNAEFVRMDPETLETQIIDIEGNHAITSPWFTWHKATLTTDARQNVVYYAPDAGWSVTTVASYNFDTQQFNPSFVSAPGIADGAEYNSVLYGEGISTDPVTGNLLLVVKKDGWGIESQYNKVYFYDPSSQVFLQDKTISLKPYYWFPSMMIYPSFQAPLLDDFDIALTMGQDTLVDLAEHTALAVGNKHLVRYTVENNQPNIVQAKVDDLGYITVSALEPGDAQIMVTADYRGKTTTAVIDIAVDNAVGVESVEQGVATGAMADVFTVSGVCVLKNATIQQMQNSLPQGIYVFGKKKIIAVR